MKTPSVSLLFGVSVLLSGFTVSADHPLVLKFSDYPVMTGSDVTLYCEKKTKGDAVEAYFYFNENLLQTDLDVRFTIHKVQRSHEGLYSCSTDLLGKSPESRLRVRDPPPTSAPPHTTTSSTNSNPHTITVYSPTSTALNHTDDPVSLSRTPLLIMVRVFLHVVVSCPYCISTHLMVSISCSRKKGSKSVVSMEMSHCEQYDDITADGTT
ncbi:uncharacterized protein [Channa argus]|uniref:uncharacterized protein n=1 Tax=Channa argus TaxID=215402 RepID=UPI003520C15F